MAKMSTDVLEGMWHQLRGEAKERWGKLSDNELDRVQGKGDQLLGLLQEKYGYSRERATAELQDFVNQYRDTVDQAKGQFRETQARAIGEVQDAGQMIGQNRKLQAGLVVAAISLLVILVYYFMYEE